MAERKRMADDLHDTIEQHLVGAGMMIKMNRLKEAEGVLVRAKREIRDIVWGLKNDDMMRMTPAEMLRELARVENEKGICRVATGLAGLPQQMDAARMRDLSLIVREAIGNAIKHGGARHVAIATDAAGGGDGWLLRVANDGAPFDPAKAPGATEGHFGLEGMRQRARRLGATLDFSFCEGWTVLSLKCGGKSEDPDGRR
jgi:signal transduction histidine kinase